MLRAAHVLSAGVSIEARVVPVPRLAPAVIYCICLEQPHVFWFHLQVSALHTLFGLD